MDEANGLRPLDLDSFRANDRKQPLRVATSYVHNGKLRTKCFGTEHFFSCSNKVVRRADGRRQGIYACLEASMTVPGAAGDPICIVDDSVSRQINNSHTHHQKNEMAFFDAFCFEPLPYRSAVEEGATHVLVLCSRPEGFQPKTMPGVYERGVANLYFRSHGQPEMANFFEQGGQQYIYAEDLLTLEEGKRAGMNIDPTRQHKQVGVKVPPPHVLYGVERDEMTESLSTNRENWKTARLLPIKVPIGTKELPTLEQERDAVGTAVREGFAAAFDLLAPAIGLQLADGLTGADVANLVFPVDLPIDEQHVLEHQLRVKGETISNVIVGQPQECGRQQHWKRRETKSLERIHAEHLLKVLPGFASGRMAHLSLSLRTCIA